MRGRSTSGTGKMGCAWRRRSGRRRDGKTWHHRRSKVECERSEFDFTLQSGPIRQKNPLKSQETKFSSQRDTHPIGAVMISDFKLPISLNEFHHQMILYHRVFFKCTKGFSSQKKVDVIVQFANYNWMSNSVDENDENERVEKEREEKERMVNIPEIVFSSNTVQQQVRLE